MSYTRLLPLLALLLGLLPAGVQAAEGDAPNLFIPVDKMRLVLVGPDEKVVGSLQFDMTIEARDLAGRDKITLLMPRIRDAILTRMPAQEVDGRSLSAAQIQDAKRRIMLLIDQTVGKANAVDVQLVKSYIQPV